MQNVLVVFCNRTLNVNGNNKKSPWPLCSVCHGLNKTGYANQKEYA